jgi:predicted small lipoprotein YifL
MLPLTRGVPILNRFRDRPFLRMALLGLAVASLGLAACGRKGPLDPPPAASVTGEPQAGAPAGSPSPSISPFGNQAASTPQTPAAPNKRIFLDNLLN